MIGPIFHRELATAPRKPRMFIYRAVYAGGLFVLMSTAWAVIAGAQQIRCVGDMARFGMLLFQIMAPLQLALVIFFAAMSGASAVAQEKDKRTLLLLLMTRLTNTELVLGKLFASLLGTLVMIAVGLPMFALVVLFGGVSFEQIVSVTLVSLTTGLLAGSLGAFFGFWRDKTFQTLAMTALVVFFWIGFWESVGTGSLGDTWWGVPTRTLAAAGSPLQAVFAATRPTAASHAAARMGPVVLYLACSTTLAVLLAGIAILRVRVWNPSRQVRDVTPETEEAAASIWGAEYDLQGKDRDASADAARLGHVDARLRATKAKADYRQVWDNPIMWREFKTWAYGRKIIVIRLVYAIMSMLAAYGLYQAVASGAATRLGNEAVVNIPIIAWWLAPLILLSLVIVNALAVTSITTERDGKAIDLLLATDLSPREFVLGKLAGVMWVNALMVVVPLLLCTYLWNQGGLTNENFFFVQGGLVVMNLFVALLGIHCGIRYANSRTAIAVSLGTVFFLFLGVVACMMMMVSLSGSFEIQLAPFVGFILGGGVGLYVALSAGKPSSALTIASVTVPFATFYSITSFLLGHHLSVFFVTTFAYGFATVAMLIPAISEFDFAMGRTLTAEE